MSLATATRAPVITHNAALFECRVCVGHHLANGSKASCWQVHRQTSRREGVLVCDGCATARPVMREGEAIPVEIGRWKNLPVGMTVLAEAVL